MDLEQLPFGAVLRYFRRAALQTQDDLALQVAYQPTLISMIERGQRFVKREIAEVFASALGLLPEEREALLAAHARTAVSRAAGKVGDGRAVAPTPGAATAPGPLVAREPEIARLTALLDGLRAGGSPWAMLSGEPGIGKTRLALEVLARAESRGISIALGHCYYEQQSAAYTPFAEVLEQMVRALPDALREAIPTRWPLLPRLLPGGGSGGLLPPGSVALDQQVIFRQTADFLRAVANTQPYLIFLDDLHWADEASLDLLLYLARYQRTTMERPGQAAPWLIGTYRDTELTRHPVLRRVLHALEKDHLVEQVVLTPLTERESTELLNAYLPSGAIAAKVSDHLYRIGGGVPFALVRLLQGMRTRGDLALDGATWRQAGSGEIELPADTLEEIREDVQRLQPLTQEILRSASVLGEVFTATAAQRMGEHSLDEVEDALAEAEDARLVSAADREGYRFEHALIQRAIYTAISTPHRRRLHRAAALALVKAPPRRGRSAALAWHFREGDDLPQALHYSLAAGDDAEATYAHKDAQQHFNMAISLARDLDNREQEAQALERLADVNYLLGLFDEAYTNLDQATAIYRALRNWERLVWATCQKAKVCDVLGRVPESMRFVEALLDTLMMVADDRRLADEPVYPDALLERAERAVTMLTAPAAARVFLCLVARLVYLSRFDEVYPISLATVTYARRANNMRMESLAYAFRGLAQSRLGKLDDATVTLRTALRTGEACGDLEAPFLAFANLGAIHQLRAELGAAGQMLLRARETLEQMGDTLRASASLCRLGVNAFLLGDWAEARARYEESLTLGAHSDRREAHRARHGLLQLDIAEGRRPLTAEVVRDEMARVYQREDLVYHLYASSSLAGMAILAGFAAEARNRLNGLPAIGRGDLMTSDSLALLAWAALECGDPAAAREALVEARRLAEALGSRLAFVTIWRIEARLALAEGRYDDGLQALDQAVDLAQAAPSPYAEAQARYVSGLLYRTRGAPADGEEARREFTQARVILHRLGERFYAERIESELAALAARDSAG